MLRNKPGIYLLIMLLAASACTSKKKYDYFQKGLNSQQKITEFAIQNKPAPPHIVDIGDMLEINYYTPDEINQSIINSSDEGEKKNKVNLFMVNGDGNIDLPLAGSCNVKGLTVSEIKDSVTLKLRAFFNITYVYVRLNSFSVNVIGEVLKPGVITVQTDRINLIQVISMAGDLTQYGNKREVMVMRKENDKVKMYEFDLTDINIVNSEAFYLRSNDIVYVKPLRAKNLLTVSPALSIGVSLLNTILILIQISR